LSLLAEVSSLLREERIDHALIGAAAMAIHGVSRATVDVDLLTVDTRALQSDLWMPCRARGESIRIIGGDFDDPLAGSVRVTSRSGDIVDVVVGRYRWQAELIAAAESFSSGDAALPVVRPAGLVLLKLHAGGPKDAWDISSLAEAHPQWEAIREEVEGLVEELPSESQRLWERLRSGA
jgi:hypothetical protein